MSNRFNNKRLLFLLAGLIAILVLTVIVKVPKENATIKSKIVDLDTVSVSRIILYPKVGNGKEIEFNRNNNKWTVKQGSIISATHEGAVPNILNDVVNMKPQSLAAVNKSKWKEFELTDSLATRIKFLDKNGKNLADIMMGKFSFKQADNPYGSYGGSNVKVTSYVRIYSEKEIYAVDGFLAYSLSMKFDDWRDNTFLRFNNNNDITGIRLILPADSSYSLSRKDSAWFIGLQKADSSSVANYLNSLKLLDGQNFKDNYKPVLNPTYQMLLEGNNLLSITVKCYKGDGPDEYILNSSLNPDVYFISAKKGIFEKVFKPQNSFFKQIKTK